MVTKQKFTNYFEKVSKEINIYLATRTKTDHSRGFNLRWKLSDNQYFIMAEKMSHFGENYDR